MIHGGQPRKKGGLVDNRDTILGMMPVVYSQMRHVTLEPRTVQLLFTTMGCTFTKMT